MKEFIDKTYDFNKYGNTPVDDSCDNLNQAFGIIQSEVEELSSNLFNYRYIDQTDCEKTKRRLKAAMADDVSDIIVTAVGFAYRMGLDKYQMDAILHVVADANLAKFPETLEDALASVEKYENDDRYENVSYTQIADDRFVVHGSPKGTNGYKILKDHEWTDPHNKLEMIVND
ncbi:MAG: hypothetical protein CMF22_10550 [Idiomarinaceae bacterium]|nr:hypothetical protein [Idiomarinaceae bacterium]MBG23880.1 hypothetical protein [Idiomarinaceae bacterium]|tara:strand:- start:3975 stop:4493 length:519 start_codon:yes stop_codon:yes gene_type:complete